VDINLTIFDETSPLTFSVGNDQLCEEFKLVIDQNGYNITHNSGSNIHIVVGRKDVLLTDFFRDYPPRIRFVDQSSLEGNLLVKLKNCNISFPATSIITWEWDDIDITKESQGQSKETDSIQYKVISELKVQNKYCLLFDDDDSGEVADVVAVQEDEQSKELKFELYHCKFSGANQLGARAADLYVVCGQAEKCVKWVQDSKALIDRLIKRESKRTNGGGISRFETGNNQLLHTLKNKLKFYSAKYQVYIVQPGVDSSQITQSMHQVLCSASSYLMDTYGIQMFLICS
jgi:hypothetical protein